MFITPVIKKDRLYQKAANVLINLIRQQHYKPGDSLPAEREMSKLLNIGRSTLREALIVLELSGWIEIRSGSGIYVCETHGRESIHMPSYEYSPHDVIQARQAIESELVGIVALSRTNEDIDTLSMLVDEMDFCIKECRVPDFYRMDRRFHLHIGKISGNNILSEMNEIIWNRRSNIHYSNLDEPNASPENLVAFNNDHRAMVMAIRSSNKEEAKSHILKHLEMVSSYIYSK